MVVVVLGDIAGVAILFVLEFKLLLAALHWWSIFELPYLEFLFGWRVSRCSIHSTHLKLTLTFNIYDILLILIQC